MQNVVSFVLANKAFLSVLAGFIISEYMGKNPNCKYNGILDFILGMLKKQAPAAAAPTEAPKA